MLELEMIMALLVSLHDSSYESLVKMVLPKLVENKSEYNPSPVVNSMLM